MWFLFALLSSVFAALTSILAKVGIEGVNSNLATAVRTVVVVIMAWVVVFMTNTQSGLPDIGRKSWIFLILSGLATGASWICYYKALQMGEASKVVPVDKFSIVLTVILAFLFLQDSDHHQKTDRNPAYHGRNLFHDPLGGKNTAWQEVYTLPAMRCFYFLLSFPE